MDTAPAALRTSLLGDFLVLLLEVLEATDTQERLLRVVVEVTLRDAVERLDGLRERHRRARDLRERLGDQHVLRQEPLDAARALNGQLVLFRELVHTEDRDDVLQLLVLLQDPDDLGSHAVVVLTDDGRVEDRRRRRQRVHRREDALLEDTTRELGGGVQVGERRGRGRVGVVVRGDVDRLHRGDRATPGRGDPLLELTHLVGQRRLVTHGRRHAAQQGRHLGTGLGEPEDVVDEQQHVLVLHIAEVLRHGQRGQGDAHARARRLVHLAEHEGGVVDDAVFAHLQEEVVALTGALADPGEHRRTTEVPGDTGDHLLDEHRLADAGAAGQADLATLDVRGEQVDDLQAGLQHLRLALELVEGRRVAVDAPALEVVAVAGLVEALAERVVDVALDLVAHRHGDRLAGVGDLGAPNQAVLRLERDGADEVVTQVAGDLEGHRLPELLELDFDLESAELVGHGTARELDVDDRTGHRHDAPLGARGFSTGHQSSLPAAVSAFAPPTISEISWVICAWRAWFISRVRLPTSSFALSDAAFIAVRRAASSDAADSSSAE